MSRRKKNAANRLERRYRELKRSVAEIGYVFPGSIAKRFTVCGKPSCRCAADVSKRHGPYYEWTRKLKGKTVTVKLTAEQARLCARWIKNRRAIKKILTQMQAVSVQAAKALADVGFGR